MMKQPPVLKILFIVFLFLCATSFASAQNQSAGISGKINRGAPKEQSRTGIMFSLGNTIRSDITARGGVHELLILALFALFYGVLHALGPGHQKTLVSGYLLSEGGGLGAAIAAGGIASASHALSVIGLFAALMLIGSGFGAMDVTSAGNLVTVISGVLLVALALFMVYRRVVTLISAIKGSGEEIDTCGCGHDHLHNHQHGEEESPARKKSAIPMLVSGSLSPCPGAALFLLYGFHEGNAMAGIIAVIAISIGMWITLIAIGVITVAMRSASIAGAAHKKSAATKYLPSVFGVLGSCAVLAIAVLMVIPAK